MNLNIFATGALKDLLKLCRAEMRALTDKKNQISFLMNSDDEQEAMRRALTALSEVEGYVDQKLEQVKRWDK